MAVIIPTVTNWSVKPQNGVEGYFALMNTWIYESTDVINSLQTAIVKMNESSVEINTINENVNTKVSQAITSANNASNSAVTASNKANEASQSANDASGFKNQAETYAQEAKEAAESVNGDLLVHKEGAEEISGVKTFTVSPVVPNATQSNQPMSFGQGVNITENQTINGVKTFSKSPVVPTPEGDYDAVNKKYVDENVNLSINSFPEKTTPENTDNLALQETGGLLKKVSFENLTKLSPNDARVKTALNAGGEAPIYACRAWVNFNGEGTVAIRASGNVSSITDNGTGDYTINFTTAMTDVNYLPLSIFTDAAGTITAVNKSMQTSSFRMGYLTGATAVDRTFAGVSISR